VSGQVERGGGRWGGVLRTVRNWVSVFVLPESRAADAG